MKSSIDKLEVKQMMQVKGGADADGIICTDGAVGVQCNGGSAVISSQEPVAL